MNTKSVKMLKKCSQGSIKKYRNTVENLEGRGGGGCGQRILLNYSNFTVKNHLNCRSRKLQ